MFVNLLASAQDASSGVSMAKQPRNGEPADSRLRSTLGGGRPPRRNSYPTSGSVFIIKNISKFSGETFHDRRVNTGITLLNNWCRPRKAPSPWDLGKGGSQPYNINEKSTFIGLGRAHLCCLTETRFRNRWGQFSVGLGEHSGFHRDEQHSLGIGRTLRLAS